MMSFGQNPTADELDDLMKEIDIDGKWFTKVGTCGIADQ